MAIDMMSMPSIVFSGMPDTPKGKIAVQFYKGLVLTLVGYCDDCIKNPPIGSFWCSTADHTLKKKLGVRWLCVTQRNFDFDQLPGFEDWREWVIATNGTP